MSQRDEVPVPMMLRQLLAELLGSLFLVATVVGSGIMAVNLADGNMALALLANAVATGAILMVLITLFKPISGAHFNPVVSVVMCLRGDLAGRVALLYVLVQCLGAVLGTFSAHMMFDLPLLQFSIKARTGGAQWFSEVLASFGLLLSILLSSHYQQRSVAWVVSLYITAAYWFTASTSFANPAVSLARAFTNSFSGIDLAHVPAFVAAQLLGGLFALWVANYLCAAKRVVIAD